MNGVIDFHVHYFPQEISQDLNGFATTHQEPFWGNLMAPHQGKSLQGWVTEQELLEKMDAAGIEKIVLQGWYWQQFETCQLHNRWMAELVHRHPDRIAAFASILPTEYKKQLALDELKWTLDQGFCGVGELHPAVQGFSLNDASWISIAYFLREQRLPVLFHVTEPVGRPYEPKGETNFSELQHFIESYADLPIILAHWGGLVFAHQLNPHIRKKWGHVYYDTSATPLLYRMEVVEMALKLVSPDRILYGSDFPLKVYPSDPNQPDFLRFKESLKKAVASEVIWEKVARENAHRLLNAKSTNDSN